MHRPLFWTPEEILELDDAFIEPLTDEVPLPAAVPSHTAIALRAYEIYRAEGTRDPFRNWLRAERELTA